MKRITFFVLLLGMEHSSFTQNLVANPGFETWEKTNKPSGWTTAQSCLKDSVYISSGSYSCRHSGGTSSAKYLGQTLAVVPGKQYNLSFFYKTEITGTGNGCRIWCYWKDSGGNSIADPLSDDILRPSKYLKSDTWLQYSINVTAPASAVAFYLEVRTYPNSIAYWDDFEFQENLVTSNPADRVSDIIIYPNPAHDYLIINNIQYLQHIDIQDFTGMIVWSSDFNGEMIITIPVSALPGGLYVVRIRTNDRLITRKFIRIAN
jgi:hypothetical protein